MQTWTGHRGMYRPTRLQKIQSQAADLMFHSSCILSLSTTLRRKIAFLVPLQVPFQEASYVQAQHVNPDTVREMGGDTREFRFPGVCSNSLAMQGEEETG